MTDALTAGMFGVYGAMTQATSEHDGLSDHTEDFPFCGHCESCYTCPECLSCTHTECDATGFGCECMEDE